MKYQSLICLGIDTFFIHGPNRQRATVSVRNVAHLYFYGYDVIPLPKNNKMGVAGHLSAEHPHTVTHTHTSTFRNLNAQTRIDAIQSFKNNKPTNVKVESVRAEPPLRIFGGVVANKGQHTGRPSQPRALPEEKQSVVSGEGDQLVEPARDE